MTKTKTKTKTVLFLFMTSISLSVFTACDSSTAETSVAETGVISIDVETESEKERETRVFVTGTDDWKELSFQLEGVSYVLPFAYQELAAAGWQLDADASSTEKDEIAANTYISCYMFKDDKRLLVDIINSEGTAKALGNCDIAGVTVLAMDELDFKLAKEVDCYSATEEVEAVYGTAADYYTCDDYDRLTYKEETKSMVVVIYPESISHNEIRLASHGTAVEAVEE